MPSQPHAIPKSEIFPHQNFAFGRERKTHLLKYTKEQI